MEVDAANRYRSRILREMNANRDNPFNSPPSSTGDHGSVTHTMSSIFSAPEGESTRRLNEDIARFTAANNNKLPVDWDAAHRKWPEFFGPSKDRAQRDLDDDTQVSAESKENRPPRISIAYDDEVSETNEAWLGSQRSRAEMQPRVDDGSDLSSLLARSPVRLAAGYSKTTRNPSPLAKVQSMYTSDPVSKKETQQRRSSLNDALDRLRKSSAQSQQNRQAREVSPQMSDARSSMTAVQSSPRSVHTINSPERDASHARSFVMPDVSHLGDFVTGTLRFSGSMKNGVPIFVKNGKVHDQQERPTAAAHAVVDSIEVPEEEEKIFVSMDMIREEILTLQAQYDKIQDYAAGLQQQVERMEGQLKSRNFSGGSQNSVAYEKLVAQKQVLESEVASLEARLDQSSRKINNHQTEKDSLSQERDRAQKLLQEACTNVNRLERKLGERQKEIEALRTAQTSDTQLRQDNEDFRHDIITLQHRRDALELENTNLADENDVLRSQNSELQDEMATLRLENSKMSQRIHALLTENQSLRNGHKVISDDVNELQENLDDVCHELDAAREEIDGLRKQIRVSNTTKRTVVRDVKHSSERQTEEEEPTTQATDVLDRTTRSLHDNTLKLKAKVKSLKKQMAESRVASQAEAAAAADAAEKNMTSAYIIPDITMSTSGSQSMDLDDMPEPPELTEQSLMLGPYKVTQPDDAPEHVGEEEEEEEEFQPEQLPIRQKQSRSKSRVGTRRSSKAHSGLATVTEISFEEPSVQIKQLPKSKSTSNVTDKRNGRDSRASRSERSVWQTTEDYDSDMSEAESAASESSLVAKQLNIDATIPSEVAEETSHSQHTSRSRRSRSHLQSQSHVRKSTSSRAGVSFVKETALNSCPTLSKDARQVLQDLCEHDCKNCIVCTRIASHKGTISPADHISGKKRVSIPRPTPITDRQGLPEDATMRPSQHPGHALAMVIKGLEDEARHLRHALTKLNAKYSNADISSSKRDRVGVAEAIHTLLRQLEVKNDQIYSLFDVLEGQKAAGQVMTEEEIEMTVLNITGMTVGDVTGHSEHFTWEGIVDQ